MLAEAAGLERAGRPAPTRGWRARQERWVDAVKSAALRQLHASRAGERLLLRAYLVGEEATELALRRQSVDACPAWLSRQMQAHLAEEQGHARAFAAALAQRSGAASAAPSRSARPDWLSRIKISRWHRLAERHAGRFESGILVPAFAIGLCAEQMAERVLGRHCRVIGESHPFRPLLASVLADESRHVRMCVRTLERMVRAEERESLAALLEEIRAIDRSFGVTGALAMLAAGLWLRLLPEPR